MKVNTIVERVSEDGSTKLYEFSAVLNEAQHAYLIQYAITSLITQGIIPFDGGEIDIGKEQLN